MAHSPKADRHRTPEAVRDAILEEARGQFFTKGFAGTGMLDIATQAGVSATTLYRVVASKEDLFERVIDAANERYLSRVTKIAMPATGSARERLKALVSSHVALMIETDQHHVLLKTMAVTPLFPDLAQRVYHSQIDSLYQAVARELERLIADGQVVAHDPVWGAKLLLGMARAVCQLTPWVHGTPPEPERVDDGLDVVVYIFAEGLRPRGTPRGKLPPALLPEAREAPPEVPEALRNYRPLQSTRDQRIMRAARDVFFDRGYTFSNIAEIAAKAGVSVASIYREFGSKEELFCRVVEDLYGQVRRECEKQLIETALPIEEEAMLVCVNIGTILHYNETQDMLRMIIAERDILPERAIDAMVDGPAHRYDLIGRYISRKVDAGKVIDHNTPEIGRAFMGISREFFAWPNSLLPDFQLPADTIQTNRMAIRTCFRALGAEELTD